MRSDRKYGNLETLEGSLMASVERRDLESAPFFQRIQALATASNERKGKGDVGCKIT
jgi:hypothetical protein